MSNKQLTHIAETNFRGAQQKFGIKRTDRRQHMYVIGKTGVGKTGFLKNMALQDIENGEGLAIIDPHGEFVEEVLESIPEHRMDDVVYFNPADMEFPVSFNIMDVPDPKYKHLIASGLIGIFTKIWANVWSARMEYILANCILALLDTPGTTLLGIPRMLVDRDYRQKIIDNLKDPVVKSFWVNEYEEWDQRYRNEAIAPVQNKVGQFLNVSFVRNIVGQSKNTIDVEDIMNTKKILLVNVSKGRIGEDNSAILGAMLITKIQLSAMERVRIPEDERKDFYLYVDEFQNFATDSFVNILSEARKYRLDLLIAHQYVGQLVTETSTAVRDAVFGNVGTVVSFRVGASDAEFLEQEFIPEFEQNDLIRLSNRDIYIKLMIDGITSRPFSARTITLSAVAKDDEKRDKIINGSRSKYAHKVDVVESEISRWAGAAGFSEKGSSKSKGGQRSQSSKGRPASPSGRVQQDGTTLYDAVCASCKKATKVIFPPTEGRDVFCKSCLKKMKSGKTDKPETHEKRGFEQDHRPSSDSRRPESVEALEGLGIEFGSSSKPDKTPERAERAKIQEVPFTPHRQKKGVSSGSRARKEINLSDLRKALDESLNKSENPKQQLERRRREERLEDKVMCKDSSERGKPLEPGKSVKL